MGGAQENRAFDPGVVASLAEIGEKPRVAQPIAEKLRIVLATDEPEGIPDELWISEGFQRTVLEEGAQGDRMEADPRPRFRG